MKRIHLAETDSTNRYLRELPPGDEELLVVTTDYQTAGRGQGTNTWESERGRNLLFSMRMGSQGVPAARQFLLSMAHALALHEALSRLCTHISIKWPNDIYWRDRKMGGTLIEVRVGSQGIRDCIVGTGIDVNQSTFLSDAPNPVSLLQVLGHEVDREQLLAGIIESQTRLLDLLAAGRYASISQMYHAALYRREGFFSYRDSNGEFEARLKRVADDGRLMLVDRDDHQRCYWFKEVQYII